jgi:endonuclease/exonuclease/phosphatase family metal-dependent hydrolase
MVIDGNDERGIDVGILTRFPIASIKTHIDDVYKSTNGQTYKIFSRDCAEYTIDIGGGKTIYYLCNHLKSQGYGSKASNDAKRKRQANRIVEILKSYDLTKDLVVVAGDFNDSPNHEPLKNLLSLANMRDVLTSPVFGGGATWTYHSGNQQLDYLLVSQPIFDALKNVGIERRGMFKSGNPHFAEVTNAVTQASDHAAVFAEFEV